MSDALITIGITCYREGDLLQECWDSVLAQTDDRWVAVFVMDGGADEKTREVFASIEHPKVVRKFAFEENVGPYPVRNKAFELTETPYHFYLDGDDMLPPGCMAAMYRTLEAHPDAAYVYGDFQHFPSGRGIPKPMDISSADDVLAIGEGCGLYETGVWKEVGGFSEVLAYGGADGDFKISLFERRARMVHCQETAYIYRTGDQGSISSRRGKAFAAVALAIVERHPSFFRDRRTRVRYLTGGFGRSIHSNLVAGDRFGALVGVLAGIWHTRFSAWQMWYWLLRFAFGESLYHAAQKRLRGIPAPQENAG